MKNYDSGRIKSENGRSQAESKFYPGSGSGSGLGSTSGSPHQLEMVT